MENVNALIFIKGFPESSVKNPPEMQETLVQFVGGEDLLEKG